MKRRVLYYAVNRDGGGHVFTSAPLRNEHLGIWEGDMETCFSEVVRFFIETGADIPLITYRDDPVELHISMDI